MTRVPRRWRVAAIQMTSTDDRAANLRAAEDLVAASAESGASLVALPENFSFLRHEGQRPPVAETLDGELIEWTAALARRHGVWILAGSIPEKIPRSRKIYNTCALVDRDGAVVAAYRKMHLFDVRMPGKAVFEESKVVEAGDRPVIAETPLGRLGLSICYDLRFPELYRRLALDGAQIVFVPSAFTDYTGRQHWMTLIRARAIENQCWLVAPAQTGRHNPRRQSHGHTAIVDPWGVVVAMLDRRPGFVTAEIDLDLIDRVRSGMPCLDHVRPELCGRRARGTGS